MTIFVSCLRAGSKRKVLTPRRLTKKSQSAQVSNSTFAYFGRIQWKLPNCLNIEPLYPRVDLSFKSKLLYYQPKDQGNLLDISLLGRSLHCPTIWWCAEKIYPGKRFDKYAILGDDICIADSKVAEVYLSTPKDLGVTISLPKSLVSDVGGAEFAKKFRCKNLTVDLSPSLRNQANSLIVTIFSLKFNSANHLQRTRLVKCVGL